MFVFIKSMVLPHTFRMQISEHPSGEPWHLDWHNTKDTEPSIMPLEKIRRPNKQASAGSFEPKNLSKRRKVAG